MVFWRDWQFPYLRYQVFKQIQLKWCLCKKLYQTNDTVCYMSLFFLNITIRESGGWIDGDLPVFVMFEGDI